MVASNMSINSAFASANYALSVCAQDENEPDLQSAEGTLIRSLSLGHAVTGIGQSCTRADCWSDRTSLVNPSQSGTFYTVTAVEFTATRQMLIKR